jgi:hemerythrin-like domain-containing protein
MGKATQDLRHEHDAILYVLEILDKMLQVETMAEPSQLEYFGELVDFLKIFADKCHHGKEENYLFKELVQRGMPQDGGPIGVMLQEHRQGRSLLARMGLGLESRDVQACRTTVVLYRDLLRSHIGKENNVLFPLADQMLDDDAQDRLFEQFTAFEEQVIGHGIHEQLHARIDTWAEAFGIQ